MKHVVYYKLEKVTSHSSIYSATKISSRFLPSNTCKQGHGRINNKIASVTTIIGSLLLNPRRYRKLETKVCPLYWVAGFTSCHSTPSSQPDLIFKSVNLSRQVLEGNILHADIHTRACLWSPEQGRGLNHCILLVPEFYGDISALRRNRQKIRFQSDMDPDRCFPAHSTVCQCRRR